MRHRTFARTPVASNGLWRTASPSEALPSVLEFALALAQNGRHANNERQPPSAAHLLFIDADICFEPEQVFRMLRFDREFVGRVYPSKVIDWSGPAIKRAASAHESFSSAPLLCVGTLCSGKAHETERRFATGIYCGGGFTLLIKRAVIVRMIAAYPVTRYNCAPRLFKR